MLSFYPLLRVIALVAAVAEPDGAAPAAEPPAVDDEVGRHAELGRRHLEHGRYQDAIAEFRRAYELRADPRLLLGIAEAYRRFGDSERASFFYERYLAAVPDDTPGRDEVERKIAELDQGRAPAPPAGVAAGPARPAPDGVAARLDLSPAERPAAGPPVWRRWWFWTAIGAVAAAGAIAAVAAARHDDGPSIPATDLGDKRFY